MLHFQKGGLKSLIFDIDTQHASWCFFFLFEKKICKHSIMLACCDRFLTAACNVTGERVSQYWPWRHLQKLARSAYLPVMTFLINMIWTTNYLGTISSIWEWKIMQYMNSLCAVTLATMIVLHHLLSLKPRPMILVLAYLKLNINEQSRFFTLLKNSRKLF